MSIYTSYLVLEDEAEEFADADRVIPPPIFQSSVQSSKVMNLGAGISKGKRGEAKMAYTSGAGAVKMSKDTRLLKEAEAVQSHEAVKRVGSRTFILQNSLWTDSEYNGEKLIEIKYGSKAYEQFALKYFNQAKYLALGEKVIFKFKDKFVKISDTGIEQFADDKLEKLFK